MDLFDIQISFLHKEGSDTEREELLRNVRTILTTPIGTCPLYREFGFDASVLDSPFNVAQNQFAVEAIEAIERWEPRVRVKKVDFQADMNGKLIVEVVISRG